MLRVLCSRNTRARTQTLRTFIPKLETDPQIKYPDIPRSFPRISRYDRSGSISNRKKRIPPNYQLHTNHTSKRIHHGKDALTTMQKQAEKFVNDELFELSQVYNTDQIPISGASEIVRLEDNPAFRVLTNMTRDEIMNSKKGEIDNMIGSFSALRDLACQLTPEEFNKLSDFMYREGGAEMIRAMSDPDNEHLFDMLPGIQEKPLQCDEHEKFNGWTTNLSAFEEWKDEWGVDDVDEENVDEEIWLCQEAEKILERVEKEMSPNKSLTDKAAARFRAEYMPLADAAKMFELHKSDPKYWTGERLADNFNVSRDVAWKRLIEQEYEEALAKGLPFNHKKVDYIFPKNNPTQLQRKKMQEKREKREALARSKALAHFGETDKLMNEEEIYREFVKASSETYNVGPNDDKLPDWVKIPFYDGDNAKPSVELFAEEELVEQDTENTPVIKTRSRAKKTIPPPGIAYPTKIKNKSGLGITTSRARMFVIEMKRKRIDERTRKYFVLGTDGVLRTMGEEDREWVNRYGKLPRTKQGLGGKMKRVSQERRRQFDKTWHKD